MSRSLPRLNPRVLGTFLIVSLPALAVALVVVLGIGQSRLRNSYSQHLSEVAAYAASTADAYVYRRILDASVMARAPAVRAAAADSRAPLDAEQVRLVDREWQSRGAPPPAFASMLETPASRFFADITTHDSFFREILLTDAQGRLIAASNPTSDYYQADEEWWQEATSGGGTGQVSVGDVQYDRSARVWALDIALPVPAPDSDRLAGVLKVAADIRELGVVVDGVRLGRSGHAALIRKDGSVVFSQRRSDPDARYFAADLLREHYSTSQQDDPQFRTAFTARGPDGSNRLVALAPSQLDASYPKLSWVVAVSQDEAELFAPMRELAWLVVAVIALIAVAVLALALWFSTRLAAPPIDQDLDLHLVEHAKLPRLEEAP